MKKVFKNYIFMYISIFLPKLLSFLFLTPFLANTLGLVGNGIASYTYSIINWAILIATFGISTYGSKKIAESKNNKDEMNINFSSILTLQIILHIIILILYLIFIVVSNVDYKSILLVFSILLIFDSIDIGWFYSGNEEFKILAIQNLVYYFITFILMILFIKGENDAFKYALITCTSKIFSILYQFIILFKKYKISNFKIDKLTYHFKNTFIFFIPNFFISIYTIFDQIMLGSMSNTSNVALYGRAESYVKLFTEMLMLVGTIILPRFSNLHKTNQKKEKEYFNKTLNFLLMFSIPLCFGIIATSKSFISWYLPSDFSEVANLIILLSPITIFITAGNIFGNYLMASDNINKYTKSLVLSALINFIINLLFIKYLGAYAAVISTVISELFVSIYLLAFVKKIKILDIKFNNILNYIISSIIMFILVFSLSNILKSSAISTIIEVITGIVVYFGMLLVLNKLNFKIKEKC